MFLGDSLNNIRFFERTFARSEAHCLNTETGQETQEHLTYETSHVETIAGTEGSMGPLQLHRLDDWRVLCSFWLSTLLTSSLLKSLRPRSRCCTGTRARFNADDIALGRRENPDERGRDVENLLSRVGYPAPSAATAEEGDHQRAAASILPPPASAPPADGTACARIRMAGFAAERRKASDSAHSHGNSYRSPAAAHAKTWLHTFDTRCARDFPYAFLVYMNTPTSI